MTTNKEQQKIITAVEGLTEATKALNKTAVSILEIVSGGAEATGSSKSSKKPSAATSGDDLESKKIQELRQIAKKLGLKAGGGREELIELIREAQEDDGDEDEDGVDLEEMSVSELKSFIKENLEDVELPKKGKKESEEDYAERLRDLIEENMSDEDEDSDDEEDEDDDSDEESDEIDLEEMDVDELKELIEEAELEVPKKKKSEKEDAYAARLREFIEENIDLSGDEDDDDEDSEDEDEDGEELTPEDLEEMTDAEIKELCEEFEIDFGKKFNRKKAIAAITEYMDNEDEE